MKHLDLIKQCKNLDEARNIVHDFEDELNSVECEHGLIPNVGQVSETLYVGFSTIKSKDWEKYIKKARKEGLSEEGANEIIGLVDQGKSIEDHFKTMLESDLQSEIQTEETAGQNAAKLIEEKAPVVTRSTTKELPVHFSKREIERLNVELVSKLQECKRQTEQQKSTNSLYSAKIKELSARIETLTTMISTGFENKTVDCEWRLNDPEPGMKKLVRLDTDETLEVEKMIPSDRQLVIEDVKAKAGKTERNLDEKEITDIDPDQEHEEEDSDDQDEESPAGKQWKCNSCGWEDRFVNVKPPSKCPECKNTNNWLEIEVEE